MADNNVLDLIQSNPELAQSLNPPDQTTAPTAGFAPDVAQYIQPTSWAAARLARTNGHLSGDDFQNTLAHHHAAVADTEATARAYETLNALHIQAQGQHDTGAALQALHGVKAGDPDYEQRFVQAGIDFPNANWNRIHEIYQPMHEAHRAHQQLTSSLAALRQEQADMKDIFAARAKGHLTDEDIANPAYKNPDGSTNANALRYVAAINASKMQPLDEDERAAIKQFPGGGSPAETKLLKRVQAGDQSAIAQNNALWNARKKQDPGLEARLQGGAAPSATPAAKTGFTGF